MHVWLLGLLFFLSETRHLLFVSRIFKSGKPFPRSPVTTVLWREAVRRVPLRRGAAVCLRGDFSGSLYPQSRQAAPEESQEKRCSQGGRGQARLPGDAEETLMWPRDQKAGKGPLQKWGEAGRGAGPGFGSVLPPTLSQPAPLLRGSQFFQLWGKPPHLFPALQASEGHSFPSLPVCPSATFSDAALYL